MSLNERLQSILSHREHSGLHRTLRDTSGLLDFCSNDYLGFAKDPYLCQKIRSRANTPVGTAASRLVSGDLKSLRRFEQYFAGIHESEAALLFSSGFSANIALFSTLPQQGDTVVYDTAIHASVRDGLRLSRARAYSFRHNDLNHLEARLKEGKGHIFIAVEALYSMDGDLAPVQEMAALAERFGATLIVDEAHSGGVFGKQGQGLCAHTECDSNNIIRVFTFGKAYGCQGALILSSDLVRRYLINFARAFIYSTGVSPLLADALYILTSEVRAADERRQKLFENIRYFRTLLGPLHPTTEDETPIIPLIIPPRERVKKIAAMLRSEKVSVIPILSPTVPEGTERLRVSIHSTHTRPELEKLSQLLCRFFEETYNE
jgi:8-amino-7-oxononanoate synthase